MYTLLTDVYCRHPFQIYEIYGYQADTWQRAVVEVKLDQPKSRLTIIFETYLGWSSAGNIIDDVTFTKEACKDG